MKKKLVLVLLLATLVLGGAFAQEKFLSIGASVSMPISFSTYSTTDYGALNDSYAQTGFGFGFDAFLDVKYATLSVGMLFDRQKMVLFFFDNIVDITYLHIGLIGKYPFSLGDKFALYPFAGVDLNLGLGGTRTYDTWLGSVTGALTTTTFRDKTYSVSDQYTNLAIIFGVGLDFNLTDSMYLRFETGYNIILPSLYENDYFIKEGKGKVSKGAIPIKFAFGYKF
jgi:opacity protein-like surface antigen